MKDDFYPIRLCGVVFTRRTKRANQLAHLNRAKKGRYEGFFDNLPKLKDVLPKDE